MSSFVLLSAIVGGLIVAALAVYAVHLWRQVWARQQAQQQAQQDAINQQQQRLREDLRILASSLLNEQVPLIEGAIRIKVLLDHAALGLSQNAQCQVFHQLHAACAHVPSHAQWRALSRAQRDEYQQLFQQLHNQYQQQALHGARWLLDSGLANPVKPA